ncbi:MAG: hypothetical protein ACOX50_00415 [Patescibacteria group bacterium]|jgi:hypothetical protein
MLWVIPIGGKGTRTRALGEFKPFTEIKGHKMLLWFLFSVKKNIQPEDPFVFITTQYFESKFHVEAEIRKIFKLLGLSNKIIIRCLPETPQGVSVALYESRDLLQVDGSVAIICPDRFIDLEIPEKIMPGTGFLSVGLDFGKERDYIKIEEGRVQLFVEKEHVSDCSSNGVFIVGSGKDLIQAIKEQLNNKIISANGEYRTGLAFNCLIERGYEIYPLIPKACYSLGSVPSINYFSSTPIAESLSQTMPR